MRTFEVKYDFNVDSGLVGLCWAVEMVIQPQADWRLQLEDRVVIARFMWEGDAQNFTYIAPMLWDKLGV